MADPRVRRARLNDIPSIVDLIYELATYEKAADECELTREQLEAALFGDAPALFAHVAEVGGEIAGCTLWFRNFSTWRGTHGIYLEDLYVRPAHRAAGLGRSLLASLAEECVSAGYARLEWSVLDWNAPAIGFYQRLGAVPMDGWSVFRLAGDSLAALAAQPSLGRS